MPVRPRAHQIEDESRRAFEMVLPSRFVYRSFNPDYGLDGEVEDFNEDELATGLRFYVQLKATSAQTLAKTLKVTLRLEQADYYRSQPLPVLMVRFHAHSGTLYTRWFHQFDPYYGGVGETSLTFRWHETDLWTERRPAELVADVKAFLALRSPGAPLPYPFYVEIRDPPRGLSAPEAALAVRGAAARRPDIVKMIGEPVPEAARVELTAEHLRVTLATVTAATLHIAEDYDPGLHGERLADDAFVMAALAYDHIGHAWPASRLAETFLPTTSVPLSPDIAFALSGAMLRAGRIRESCELAETLDGSEDEDKRAGSFAFTLPALAGGAGLSPTEVAAYRRTMASRISRRAADGDGTAAARECASFGNHYRNRGEVHEALPLYERALELDPGYAEREHYWRELAGVLFGLRRYSDAAEAYGKARALDDRDPFLSALHADALMFGGEYELARDLLSSWETDPRPRAGEWRLKRFLLDHVVDVLGIKKQERQPMEAARRADPAELPESVEQARTTLEALLELDALSELAWFNLAHANLQLGRRGEILLPYLVPALLNEGDPESWVRAYWFAVESGRADIALDIIATGYRFCGSEFGNEAARFAREQGESFPADAFMTFIHEAIVALPNDDEDSGFTMRFIDDDGEVEQIQIHGPADEPVTSD